MGERSPHNDPNARANVYRHDDGYDAGGYDAGSTWKVWHLRLRDSLEVAQSHSVLEIEAYQDLRRRSKEPAVEEDHRECDEPEG